MKKRIFDVILTVATIVLLLAALTVFCSAENTLIAEGYCVKGQDESGKAVLTNIKWEIYIEDGLGTIYFNIDKSKNDSNTVIHVRQKDGSELVYWKTDHYNTSPWGEYTVNAEPVVTKAVIGEGITEINGAVFAGTKIITVEMPKTVVKIAGASFARMGLLTT